MAISERCRAVGGRTAVSWCRGSRLWWLALLGAACAEPEPLALEHEVYEVDDGNETLVEASCDELPQDGSSFGFGLGTAPGIRPVSYSFNYDFQMDRVSFSAGSTDGAVRVERQYDEAFLGAGGVDDFLVELGDNFALHVINRAAAGCSGAGTLP
jgi:hypothetical protein